MTELAIKLENVSRHYPYFSLDDVSLALEPGQIMGFVGPNGAGKSTSIRIMMGLLTPATGTASVLGFAMPEQQAQAKQEIGYVSSEMSLFPSATIAWHMEFVRAIYTGWDGAYAKVLLDRFNLHPGQTVRSLSQGERAKVLLLLVLTRRPRLLILDEPTSGLDPVARHEVLTELMDVLKDDERAILFSSHNTVDVEQISDVITFIDRGRIIESSDKETFLEKWRRLKLDVPHGTDLPKVAGIIDVTRSGQIATATSNAFSESAAAGYEQAGIRVHQIQRMTLEEIFVANVMHSRGQRT